MKEDSPSETLRFLGTRTGLKRDYRQTRTLLWKNSLGQNTAHVVLEFLERAVKGCSGEYSFEEKKRLSRRNH